LPNISVSGAFSLNDGIAGPATGTNLINFREVFSYTRGRHSLLFGGELSHDNDKQQTLLDNWGSFTFAGKFTGNNLADFELGLQSSQEQDAPVTPYTNSFYTALFIQDNFRIFPRLTLNMGLRWDV
jgi:outer membrane receptor protein involved in Fe transport